MFKIITFAFSITLFSCTNQNKFDTEVNKCTNFLAKWGLDHPKIKYQNCITEPRSKIQPKVIATYDVAGNNAKDIETYLRIKFRMEELVFTCCGWGPRAKDSNGLPKSYLGKGIYNDPQYINPFTISLTSEETTEKNWKKVNFKVIIETNYTEI
ncbi:MAG: DUF4952 domain-containing protein [Bacteriovoracaceae bacterium]|jgi:hypothetical protein|nr:DUF4952 domain-containing protein [Bacteriovoracaceae bacterium]